MAITTYYNADIRVRPWGREVPDVLGDDIVQCVEAHAFLRGSEWRRICVSFESHFRHFETDMRIQSRLLARNWRDCPMPEFALYCPMTSGVADLSGETDA